MGFWTHTKMYRSEIRYIFDEKIFKNVWDFGPIQKCIGPKSDTFLTKNCQKCMGFRTNTKMYRSEVRYIFDEKIFKNVWDFGPIQKCIGPKSDTFLTKKSSKMYGISDPYKNVSVRNPIHF